VLAASGLRDRPSGRGPGRIARRVARGRRSPTDRTRPVERSNDVSLIRSVAVERHGDRAAGRSIEARGAGMIEVS
jgi:hypothetical protein